MSEYAGKLAVYISAESQRKEDAGYKIVSAGGESRAQSHTCQNIGSGFRVFFFRKADCGPVYEFLNMRENKVEIFVSDEYFGFIREYEHIGHIVHGGMHCPAGLVFPEKIKRLINILYQILYLEGRDDIF